MTGALQGLRTEKLTESEFTTTYQPTDSSTKSIAFTMPERRSSRVAEQHLHFGLLAYGQGFTMAEILISLTIIGVIAAITLPSLRANINEKTWATQRKALYSRMSQAISMMPSLNGYGIGATEQETACKATQAFITDGLSKVLKINNICDNNFAKCGFPDKFTKMGINSKISAPTTLSDFNRFFNINLNFAVYSQLNTMAVAFETANAESVLTFYNPNCSYSYAYDSLSDTQSLLQPTMCVNFIFDLNGKKGPNKVGKDIGFITAFYPTDTEVVMPYPLGSSGVAKNNSIPTFSISTGNKNCRKLYGDDARMANIEELKSIFLNNKLGYVRSDYPYFMYYDTYVSSTVSKIYSDSLYILSAFRGKVSEKSPQTYFDNNGYIDIFCVKR